MFRPTTHFAPEPQKPSRQGPARGPTLLSVTALAGVPGLVRRSFGEKVLRQANQAAMLDIELIEDQDCFIPHATMTAFLNEIERRVGEPEVGLLMAPHLRLEGYGCYGGYILAAPTLRDAIGRGIAAMEYHSRGDRVSLQVRDGLARFAYHSAARGRDGYRHVACGALGVMVNLCRAFLPAGWRPLRVEMDIPKPRATAPFEDAFDCPVVFDRNTLAVCIDARWLNRPGRAPLGSSRLTLADVARARSALGAGEGLRGVVAGHIWTQVLAGKVSIESTARALDTSVRSLQRALQVEGADFRSLTNEIRARRAKELLAEVGLSITEIAFELGYSSPAHFARAFQKSTGLVPQDFRRMAQAQTPAASRDEARELSA